MATLEEFNAVGMKFTMMDVARRLSINKATLYCHFHSKEELIGSVLDTLMAEIHQQDDEILQDAKLGIPEKMKAIMINNPKVFLPGNNSFLYAVKYQFPGEWGKLQRYREEKWRLIEFLLIQGMDSGIVQPIKLPIVKLILTSTLIELTDLDFLQQNELSFSEAVSKAVDVFLYGIIDS